MYDAGLPSPVTVPVMGVSAPFAGNAVIVIWGALPPEGDARSEDAGDARGDDAGEVTGVAPPTGGAYPGAYVPDTRRSLYTGT